ncbi:MAG: 5-formyltetrahydrofolate cyclo-ligase [Microthrixaceae bacterium]
MTQRSPHEPGTLDDLRRRCREARRRLGPAERTGAEAQLVDRLLALDELSGAATVAWYLPTDGEVDLRGAVDVLRARGATLWLPVIGEARSMQFARWAPDTELVVNRYGIPEPASADGSRPAADTRRAEELDVVVVPCVAVDERGTRVGFGAGYYDRALGAVPIDRRPHSIGVAFEAQVVGTLEPAPWDVPLDVVVTEARTMRVGRL